MGIKELSGKTANISGQGFSLIELLMVIAILGIMSMAVGVSINSSKTKLKTFTFNTKTRFNQAKFEAIKRSRSVYLDFDFYTASDVTAYVPDGIIDNGFTIWVDEDGSGDYDDVADGDSVIDQVVFANMVSGNRDGPEIYCSTCASGGPGTDGPGPDKTIDDGVQAGSDRFKFKPGGDSTPGTVYFYFPQGAPGAKVVTAGPFAIIVNSVGRVRIDEWKSADYGWEVDT